MKELLKMYIKAELTFVCMNMNKLALMCYRSDLNKRFRRVNTQNITI